MYNKENSEDGIDYLDISLTLLVVLSKLRSLESRHTGGFRTEATLRPICYVLILDARLYQWDTVQISTGLGRHVKGFIGEIIGLLLYHAKEGANGMYIYIIYMYAFRWTNFYGSV